jgi:hypothetical protein
MAGVPQKRGINMANPMTDKQLQTLSTLLSSKEGPESREVSSILGDIVSSGDSNNIKQVISLTDFKVTPKHRSNVYEVHIIPALAKSRSLELLDLAATLTFDKVDTEKQILLFSHHIVPGFARLRNEVGLDRAVQIAETHLKDSLLLDAYESNIIPGYARLGDRDNMEFALELAFTKFQDPFTLNSLIRRAIVPELVRCLEADDIEALIKDILIQLPLLQDVLLSHVAAALKMSAQEEKKALALRLQAH